jgi:phosphatidylserine decarboxylase
MKFIFALLLWVVQCSPADGKVFYYGKVESGILEQVKGKTYSLQGFLGNCFYNMSPCFVCVFYSAAQQMAKCYITARWRAVFWSRLRA